MRILITFIVITAMLVATAACSGDSNITTDTSPTPVATVAQPDAASSVARDVPEVRAYVAALAATDDPGTMRDGLQHAAPHSVAHAYLAHRANLFEAMLDGGTQADRHNVTPTDGGFELCYPDGFEDCGRLTDFKVIEDLVSDFRVDGEQPGPRLTVGNGDIVKDGGVAATFLSAYQAIGNGALFVALEVTSGPEVDLNIHTATYRAPDGRQREVSQAYGPLELGADSHAGVALAFAGTEPGGQVTLTGNNADFSQDIKLVIQVG